MALWTAGRLGNDSGMTVANLSHTADLCLSIAASRFEDCDFRGLTMTHGQLGNGTTRTHYAGCDFSGMRATEVNGGMSTFIGCTFRDVRLTQAFFLDCEFVDCVFTGEFSGVVLSGGPGLSFHGNDFSGVEWRSSEFRGGIDLNRQRLPIGPYVVVPDLKRVLPAARGEVYRHWAKGQTRNDVLLCFFVLDWIASSGQDQALLRIDEVCEDPAAARRAVDLLLRP